MFKQVKIDEEFDAHLLSLPDPGKYPSDKDADGRYTHKDTQNYHAGWLASRQALYFEFPLFRKRGAEFHAEVDYCDRVQKVLEKLHIPHDRP